MAKSLLRCRFFREGQALTCPFLRVGLRGLCDTDLSHVNLLCPNPLHRLSLPL
ncbi:MAG: hypothetical protein HC838_06310 [Spirulinaceae cyanobacterium RM2_2_10]|nr:hypothetical protein [Spirulinaceae cyanobacterium RM2_2_10]